MATLINADEFRERFDIDVEIRDTRIEPHIGSASRRLRGWVGDAVYAAAVALAISGQDDDTDTVNDLKSAEAHLTFHFAIAGFNSPMSSKGVVATAMASEGREVRRYLTPTETAELASQYLELAREIAKPYITESATSGFEVVTTDCDLEAVICG
ncbi:hypothetical protein BH10ACI2_BH10ACI2_21070 [soil metagenome]